MANINTVVANATITSTGVTQPLDPNGPQLLAFRSLSIQAGAPPITVNAPAANAATVFITNQANAAAGVGFPLQPGGSVNFRAYSTGGLYINGTAGDTYGFAGGSTPRFH